jgi:hypothetical protein
VQGRLREERLSVAVETECAHCAERLQLELDSELTYRVNSAGAEPLVFMPHVEWAAFNEPNIIHSY